VGGSDLLREGLEGLAFFRLLLGSEPGEGCDLGLTQAMRRDLNAARYDEETLHQVEALWQAAECVHTLRDPHSG
jgi:hypothetical protein